MTRTQKTTAIVLAAGAGERFGTKVPKQFIPMAGTPLVIHSLLAFSASDAIDEIVVVGAGSYLDEIESMVRGYRIEKVTAVVEGGERRQQSSKIGVDAASKDTEIVLIHDAARPFVSDTLIARTLEAAIEHGAVNPVTSTTNTIVEIDDEGFITETPDRGGLRGCQTPQGFRYALIKEAHEYAASRGRFDFTDDSSLILFMGKPVYTIPSDPYNMKITHKLDFDIAEALYERLRTDKKGS